MEPCGLTQFFRVCLQALRVEHPVVMGWPAGVGSACTVSRTWAAWLNDPVNRIIGQIPRLSETAWCDKVGGLVLSRAL
jgi:hypothetical protein